MLIWKLLFRYGLEILVLS